MAQVDWQVKNCAKMDAICDEIDVNALWTTWEQGTKLA